MDMLQLPAPVNKQISDFHSIYEYKVKGRLVPTQHKMGCSVLRFVFEFLFYSSANCFNILLSYWLSSEPIIK
jgi:hypothetical protein